MRGTGDGDHVHTSYPVTMPVSFRTDDNQPSLVQMTQVLRGRSPRKVPSPPYEENSVELLLIHDADVTDGPGSSLIISTLQIGFGRSGVTYFWKTWCCASQHNSVLDCTGTESVYHSLSADLYWASCLTSLYPHLLCQAHNGMPIVFFISCEGL